MELVPPPTSRRSGETEPTWAPSNEYAKAMAPEIVGAYIDLGLDHEFAAILFHHLEDLHVVVGARGDDSFLGVRCHKELVDGKPQKRWHRVMDVGRDHLKQYSTKITECSHLLGGEGLSDPQSQKLALDWIMFELSADAAANSCYMQHKFGRYVPDYNGQSEHFRSELTIARSYLESAGVEGDFVNQRSIEADHADFVAGSSLLLLQNAILRHGLSESYGRVQWFINKLRLEYPDLKDSPGLDPMSDYDIIQRLSSVPRLETRKMLAQYALLLDDDWDQE